MMKESTSRLKKLNDQVRKEQEYSKYRSKELNTIINKAEQYINDKLNSNENENQINDNSYGNEYNQNENYNDNDNVIIEDDQDLQQYNDIVTTSSMRERLKGLDTKERVKLLMKRSMSEREVKKVKNSLDERIDEEYQSNVIENSPSKSLKNKLDKLNSMNNPMSKHLDDDAMSMRSSRSNKADDRDREHVKRSNMVKILQDEVKKEKNAKNNALNILKNLSTKSKEVEMAMQQLSN